MYLCTYVSAHLSSSNSATGTDSLNIVQRSQVIVGVRCRDVEPGGHPQVDHDKTKSYIKQLIEDHHAHLCCRGPTPSLPAIFWGNSSPSCPWQSPKNPVHGFRESTSGLLPRRERGIWWAAGPKEEAWVQTSWSLRPQALRAGGWQLAKCMCFASKYKKWSPLDKIAGNGQEGWYRR